MTGILKVEGMTVHSATRTVVDDVSIEVPAGKITAMLGPNGAGKSEMVLGIVGAIPSTGRILIDGRDITGSGVQNIRLQGIAAVPEGHQVLAGMSVIDNLRASGPMLSVGDLQTEIQTTLDVFPELKPLFSQLAGSLSGGQQQMLAIAQALISKPKYLLIDEMSLGLAPVVIDRLVCVIQQLCAKGIGILLIEQFTLLALDVSDYCYVMAQGKLQFSGTPKKLKRTPQILEQAYLGS